MADKLLRFKDILKMNGQEKPLDRPKLSFDDLHVSQYRPGEDELINYRAYRRKRAIACEETDYSESVEVELDEAKGETSAVAIEVIPNKLHGADDNTSIITHALNTVNGAG